MEDLLHNSNEDELRELAKKIKQKNVIVKLYL